jgi:predicted amidophosphoribosyltransferase
VLCAAPYEGAARELVAALKFGRLLPVAQRMAEAIRAAVPEELLGGTLVPVPAAPSRRRQRGFDPAEQLAGALAEAAGLELRRCLAREDGPRQVGRPRPQRIAEPPRVTAVESAPSVALLIDDVCTTGTTLVACARVLRGAGSDTVTALTFARTP